MPWLIFSVAVLSTAGLLVLGALAVRVYREVLLLSRELDGSARRLSRSAAALEFAAEPVARRAGQLVLNEPGPT